MSARLQVRELAMAVAGRKLWGDLSFEVTAGQCCAIVGPNGAGKTTLVAGLAGFTSPTHGSIAYDGVELSAMSLRERARRRGWVGQTDHDAFPATVLETVLAGRHPHVSRWHWETGADAALAQDALASVGLAGFESRAVGTLSGGERRRVAIATVLAQDPMLLLLDEPTAHLDLAHQVAVLEHLSKWAHEGRRAVVMVLHDLHLAMRYADVAVALGSGIAQAGPADEVLTPERLSDVFGHRLVLASAEGLRTLLPA